MADAKDMKIAVALAAHLSYRDSKLGKMGAASPVRRINPATGEVMADPVIKPGVTTASKAFKRPRRRGYWHKQFAAKLSDEKA